MSGNISKWPRRLGVTAAMTGGIIALSMTAGWAAGPNIPVSPSPGSPGPSSRVQKVPYGGATATALGDPATVAVSHSEASGDRNCNCGPEPAHHAEWSALTVAGTNVLGKEDGDWTGTAAVVGPQIDAISPTLCPDYIEIDADTGAAACVYLLPSYASSDATNGSGAGGFIAMGGVAAQNDGKYYVALAYLFPSFAWQRNYDYEDDGGGSPCYGSTQEGEAFLALVQLYGGDPSTQLDYPVWPSESDWSYDASQQGNGQCPS